MLLGEASNQGYQGMEAVAEVIATRCKQKHLTPYTVVTKRRSFSCLNGVKPERLVRKWQYTEGYAQALALALTVSQAPFRLGTLARGATHFTRSNERPKWALNARPVAIIGSHAFYRLDQF